MSKRQTIGSKKGQVDNKDKISIAAWRWDFVKWRCLSQKKKTQSGRGLEHL